MATKILTDATFAEEIKNATTPILVDFWAEWCGPCKMVAPILDQIAAENDGKIVIAKLNVDENPKTAQALGITSIPTMHVYKDGAIAKTIVGAKPKPALLADLASFL
jgi:thioredoxin 1